MGRQGLSTGQGQEGLGCIEILAGSVARGCAMGGLVIGVLAGSVARGCAAGEIGNRDSGRFCCAGLRDRLVWVKTLHQDHGRKEESMGFRRANYRATLERL